MILIYSYWEIFSRKFNFRALCIHVHKALPGKRNKGNVLFNDALNTFYLWLYVRHMVKDHSDSKRGNQLPPHGLPFPISS